VEPASTNEPPSRAPGRYGTCKLIRTHRPALRSFVKPSLANDDGDDTFIRAPRTTALVVIGRHRRRTPPRDSSLFSSGDPTCVRTERESCTLYALRRAEKQSGFDPLTVEIFFHGSKKFRREVSWISLSLSLLLSFLLFQAKGSSLSNGCGITDALQGQPPLNEESIEDRERRRRPFIQSGCRMRGMLDATIGNEKAHVQ